MYEKCKILIFGGTTEGRELAEFCEKKDIPALSSVTAEYGAKLLPESARVTVGRLDSDGMAALIGQGFSLVIDATHPYAAEASKNIKAACGAIDVRYFRVIREKNIPEYGETVSGINELVKRLNDSDRLSGTILSTLGSKEAEALTRVFDHSKRVWLRILPSAENIERCVSLGFDRAKIIAEKGPFTHEQNIGHIKKSAAKILLTKNSGIAGGYPEKISAARECQISVFTVERPCGPHEDGVYLDEMKALIDKENGYGNKQ